MSPVIETSWYCEGDVTVKKMSDRVGATFLNVLQISEFLLFFK